MADISAKTVVPNGRIRMIPTSGVVVAVMRAILPATCSSGAAFLRASIKMAARKSAFCAAVLSEVPLR